MTHFKNPKLVIVGITLVFLGAAMIGGAFYFRSSSKEISRAELEQLIETKSVTDGQVIPSPYPGIYRVEGTRKIDGKAQHFYVTTHLDEAQVKGVFAQTGVKVEIPGQGF